MHRREDGPNADYEEPVHRSGERLVQGRLQRQLPAGVRAILAGNLARKSIRLMTRSDVVFTFSVEMLDDAVQREFCRPPDQTLLALAGDDQVGRLLIADSWRSLPVSLLRRRPVQPREQITIAGRAATR